MLAETDIGKLQIWSEVRRYIHMIDIPPDDYPNINTVYVFDIGILIDDKHPNHNIFIKFINLEYLYLEEKIDTCILNDNNLIKSMFEFDKLKVFVQPFNRMSVLNTWVVDNDRMLIVTSNNIIPKIPLNINNLKIFNTLDLNLDDLSANIEYLRINMYDHEKAYLNNLPINLKSLIIYCADRDDERAILTKTKLPHGCNILLDTFCAI
jgi:hypothetical protein